MSSVLRGIVALGSRVGGEAGTWRLRRSDNRSTRLTLSIDYGLSDFRVVTYYGDSVIIAVSAFDESRISYAYMQVHMSE